MSKLILKDENGQQYPIADQDEFDNKVNVDSSLFHSITNNDTWTNIIGTNNNQKSVLTSLRDDSSNGDGPTVGKHGSGIAFGGWDTKAVLSVDFDSPKARIAGGNADKPAWHEDIAWKSDVTTKTINQDVDINTLTEEGKFFVESNNLNHFPTNYQNSWYFLNVESTIDHGGAGRIKQTVVPDNTGQMNWILVRSGLFHDDGSVSWCDWLILDFANGKLLHSQ